MVVLILESTPQSLRGELSKWMLEPKAGVFVGTVSAAVRELLWQKTTEEAGAGGCTMVYSAANEQGFAIRSFGDTTRSIEEWEGLYLVRRPISNQETTLKINGWSPVPSDWTDFLHLELWGKSNRGVELAEGEGQYHPLICHIIDTAMTAERLWRYCTPNLTKETLCGELGL